MEVGLPTIKLAELMQHPHWVGIDGKVYDVSMWTFIHPGGGDVIRNVVGMDASVVFHTFHVKHGTSANRAHVMLKGLKHVANLESRVESTLEEDFRKLGIKLVEDGLYETNYAVYGRLVMGLMVLYGCTIYCTMTASTAGGTMGAAMLLGLFFQQCAFIGHDAGHVAITHHNDTDTLIGTVVGPLLTGVCLSWWKHSHNVHHVTTNSISHDPDVQHMPILATTPKLFEHGGCFSVYHQRFMNFDWLAKQLITRQHYLFFPIMALARWNLYVQGLIFVTNRKEYACLGLFATWLALLTMCLPTWSLRLLFLVASHAFAGFLHLQIVLSHFSMPMYRGRHFDAPTGEEFLRRQCATCMDVHSNWYTEWFHGGLQFQLAHHLFPRVPRHNLRRVQTLVYQLCRDHQVPYVITSFREGISRIINTLACTAAEAHKYKIHAM
jgi:fatty acid desaturase